MFNPFAKIRAVVAALEAKIVARFDSLEAKLEGVFEKTKTDVKSVAIDVAKPTTLVDKAVEVAVAEVQKEV